MAKASNCTVRIDKAVQWPAIGISGGDFTLGQLMQGLMVASVAQPRILEGVLFLAPPPAARAVGTLGMTEEQHKLYIQLLKESYKARGLDLGPLPYGALQIPAVSLPLPWSQTLLSTYAPYQAYEQVGIDAAGGVTPQAISEAIPKWLALYQHEFITSLPNFTVRVVYQRKSGAPAESKWISVMGSGVNFPLTCN